MKTIDAHIHIGKKEHFHEWVLKYEENSNPLIQESYEVLSDPDRFCSFLKNEGVERAVILAENSPLTTGVVPNDYVLSFCRGKEMLIPFCSINPNTDPTPPQTLEMLVERGFRGLKLYPPYHLHYSNETRLYPLYAKAEELEVPVMFHTGSSVFRGARLKYGDPIFLDDVAVDFPDLTLIMAHSGRGLWYDTAFLLARLHKNVHMEISGLPPKNLLKYFPALEKNADKILFGSDFPTVGSIRRNIEGILKLPISDGSKEKILFSNADRIMKII
jgi:predicted TIM-barrel fold metal-dependent hydrolase